MDILKIAILFDTSNGHDRALLRGITKYSRIHGPWALHKWSAEKPIKLSQLEKWGADGVIMRESRKNTKLLSADIPIVVSPFAQKEIEGVGNILGDSEAIGKTGAEHLLERGLQNFAFCGTEELPWSCLRGESFKARILKAGFKTHFYEQPKSKLMHSWENEQKIMADWLKSLPKPVGILACNDERAQQAIEACNISGILVPDCVAVLGINNDQLLCELSDPPLSSIALSAEQAGYEAAKMLHNILTGKKTDKKTIIIKPLYVVTRQSSDILEIQDSELSAALQYIHQHYKVPVQVNDVADAVGVSRRVLEKRFRKYLGRSLHDEIRRVRIEHISWLLLETDLSVTRIAYTLGFSCPETFSSFFKRGKGISPLNYRQKNSNK
ncbi:MAG: XylR family transcriptional regulator [Planctomycetota bacterium]|jgi:LacI family transcriptional regulator